MARSRPQIRSPSGDASETSSSSSPERAIDDDTDFFMAQANDSQSSIGVSTFNNMSMTPTAERDPRRPPIDKLPSELLIAIFAKLNSTIDLRNCMLVSSNWANHAVGILWHRPLCNDWKNLVNVVTSIGSSDGFFRYAELVKRLNLSALAERVNDGTVQPFMLCKRVERLTLTNCSKLTDAGVSDLVDGNKHLQALDVTDLEALTDHSLFTVTNNCPRLQGLNITNCARITDESLVAVSENCRQIKRLKLNGVVQVTDRSILSFAEHCPSMLEIDLHDCKLITSPSVTALLSTLRNLRELRLAHCVKVTESAFLQLSPRMVFDSLRILDLTACEAVTDDAIIRIIGSAPRLRNLVLAKCKNITDLSVDAICKLGKNLHYIHLGHCANLTDAAVGRLVKCCNRIRYIDLACCNRLTDASVQQLASLPKLRRIGLVKCQAITDRSIQAIAKTRTFTHHRHSSMPCSLERVHLSYCVNLTLTGIHELLNACPRLTHLSLTGVQAFLREDLTVFCREAPNEFTPQQREVFCVFSGEGVINLRKYLNGHQRTRGFYGDVHEQEGTMFHDAEDDEETIDQDGEGLDDEEGGPVLTGGQVHIGVQMATGLLEGTGLGDESIDDDVDMTPAEGQHMGGGSSGAQTPPNGGSVV